MKRLNLYKTWKSHLKAFYRNIFIGILFFTVFTACNSMDSIYNVFLEEGETIYPSKADSLKTFAGDYRVKLQWLITSDPSIVKAKVFWNNNTDSLEVPINRSTGVDTISTIIENLDERMYTFQVYTFDNFNNKSVLSEVSGTVYGDIYKGALVSRELSSFDLVDGDVLKIGLGESPENSLLLELYYTNVEDKIRKISVLPEETEVYISDRKKGTEINYCTLYLPEPEAIDTFGTDVSSIVLQNRIVNVALNKNVTVSGEYNTTYVAANAVDGGDINPNSRWVSENTSDEHWIIIDLGSEYEIFSFQTYVGGASLGNPIANFSFQAEINGEWVDLVSETGNTDPAYGADFDPVKTSRVRYYVPAYAGNLVRLFEIEVYAELKF